MLFCHFFFHVYILHDHFSPSNHDKGCQGQDPGKIHGTIFSLIVIVSCIGIFRHFQVKADLPVFPDPRLHFLREGKRTPRFNADIIYFYMWPVPDSKDNPYPEMRLWFFLPFALSSFTSPRHFFQHDIIIRFRLCFGSTAFPMQKPHPPPVQNSPWKRICVVLDLHFKINPVILKFQILFLNRNLESRMSADTEIHLLIINYSFTWYVVADFFFFKFPCDVSRCNSAQRILFSCFRWGLQGPATSGICFLLNKLHLSSYGRNREYPMIKRHQLFYGFSVIQTDMKWLTLCLSMLRHLPATGIPVLLHLWQTRKFSPLEETHRWP